MKASITKVFMVTAALVGGVLLYSQFHKQQPAVTAGASEERPSAPPVRPPASMSDAAAEVAAEPPPVAVRADFAAEFRSSTDYYAFIRFALPAAQAGDPDAAYYLAAALAFCNDTHRFFFREKGKGAIR